MKQTSRFLIPLILIPVAFAAPPRQNQEFVKKLYQDLLHRSPGPVEMLLLGSVLDSKGGGDGAVSVITSSREFRTGEVRDYYNNFLGRQPSEAEVSALIGLLFQGLSNDDAKVEILASDEYYRRGGGSNAGFLAKLYMDALGRPIDSAAAFGLEAMLGRMPRKTVVLLVVKSAEAHVVVIRRFYQRYLRRDPHTQEIADLMPILGFGGQDAILIGLLCNSDEYSKK